MDDKKTPHRETPEKKQSPNPEMEALEVSERPTARLEEKDLVAERRDDDLLHAEDGAVSQISTNGGQSTDIRPSPVEKERVLIEVEQVLEEGMGEFYAELPPEAKIEFKRKGEEVSREIAGMVHLIKINVHRISQMIYAWLQTIPGVNRFFLEQESKIKTDRIRELIEAQQEDSNLSIK